MDKQEQVGGGVVTFEYFPIETAPRDSVIALWCPERGLWLEGYWDDQKFNRRPRPYWATYRPLDVATDRNDQPTHWAEIEAMGIKPSASEPQAPSTTSHQTENRGSTTGLEKGGE